MTTTATFVRSARIALALSLAVATAAPASLALACGSYTDFPPVAAAAPTPAHTPARARERATGVWPEITRNGRSATLELAYPRFEQSGAHLYLQTFRVVPNAQLAAVESAMRQHGRWPMSVTVEQVRPNLWRIVSFRTDRG